VWSTDVSVLTRSFRSLVGISPPTRSDQPAVTNDVPHSYFDVQTVSCMSFVRSWIWRVSVVFNSSALDSFSSTSVICCSCAPRWPSVASSFRSEWLDDAPTRKPIYSSATVVTRLSGKLKPVEVNHAGSHAPLAM
jgi:hypothetical protein